MKALGKSGWLAAESSVTTATVKVKSVSDAETSPDYLARAEEIAAETRLSLRQAELYVLHIEHGESIRDSADRMEISHGNASEKWHTVKQKIRNAREDNTADLQIDEKLNNSSSESDYSG